jgi:hypothetical protein
MSKNNGVDYSCMRINACSAYEKWSQSDLQYIVVDMSRASLAEEPNILTDLIVNTSNPHAANTLLVQWEYLRSLGPLLSEAGA